VVKALHHGFDDSLKIRMLVDPSPVILVLLNTKSIGFNRLSRTTTVPSFKSFQSGVLTLSCYRTHPPSNIIYIHLDKMIALYTPPCYIVRIYNSVNSSRLLTSVSLIALVNTGISHINAYFPKTKPPPPFPFGRICLVVLGHEKMREEQLKWSLAFRLYIGVTV